MSRRQNTIRLRSRPLLRPCAAGHPPLLLAMALAAGFAAAPAGAQPAGAQAVHGSATLSQQGSRLVVTTRNGAGSSHSAIDWQSFSVPGGTTTHFAQPGVTSTSINRVLGPDPSAIFGTLSSNGRLVLVNPAGIAVGAGAVVDTAGFTASTLRMSDADAITGRLRFGDGGVAGPLRVDGQVLARSGDVVLIGTDVQAGAQALIQSPGGATVLAAGQKVELTGRGLEGILLEVQAPGDRAVNLGTLRGDAVGVFAGTLRHSGLVQASGVSVSGGRVVLQAAQHAEAAGMTQAQGLAGAGGQVDVLGRTVGVMAGAVIDTSNTAGGGQIRIGGDYKGGNAQVPNAQVAWLAPDAQLLANATDRGDGGKVIVWADDTTRAYGRIEARGGANGGDGGFVETSGKRYLDANGARVDASAPQGLAGTWLLDPSDISIVAGSFDGQNLAGTPQAPTFASSDGAPSTLSVDTLNAAINGNTSVTVSTANVGQGSGDIVFDTSAGAIQIAKNTSGTTDLRLQADGQIRFTGSQYQTHFLVNDANDAGTLNVHLLANGSGPQVVTDSGAMVQFSTQGFPGNGNRLNVVLPTGKTWQNDGSITVNLNSMLRMDGATFNNSGVVDGAAGPYGGIGGYGSLGTFTNTGSVYLTEGQFRVASLANSGSMEFSGNSNLAVTQSYSSPGTTYFAGNNLSITQQSGDLLLDTTVIDGANAALAAPNGSVVFDYIGASLVESGRVAGGSVAIQARDQVTGYTIDVSGGGGEGAPGAGGDVSITAGGDITIEGYIGAYGGGWGESDGARGGNVSLVSGGSVNVTGGIDAWGGWTGQPSGSGGAGGTVQIRAAADVVASYVDASGGDGGAFGGRGGIVDIEAGRSLQVRELSASGGWGGYGTGGAGGAGGEVRLVQRNGDLDLSTTAVDVGGGWGGDGSTIGGAGGQGGRIKVEALGGGVLLDAYRPMDDASYLEGREPGSLKAGGGDGGHDDGSATAARGGQGGHGGSIEIRAAGSSRLQGKIDATGGYGGHVEASTAVGGSGGNGGAIQVGVSGALQVAGDLHAGAGAGGQAYLLESYEADPARTGAAGATGTVRMAASGGIVVPATVQVADYPQYEPQAVLSETGTTTTIVPGELRVDAQWTNASQLSIQSGATVMTTGTLVNDGVIDIAAGASLDLGHHDPYSETFSAGGVALFNGASGTLQGSGTIAGDLVNAGTVAPGGAGAIGALQVSGNFTQQPTGVLQMDIAADTTYVPGLTYDQLVVQGSAALDGQLQLAAVPAVAGPTASLLVAGATQFVATSTIPTAYYELLSAGSSSGQFSLISGPPELVSQIRMTIGGIAVPVPGFTALPSPSSPLIGTGLIAAIQEVLPGISLDQIQQVVTESQNNSLSSFEADEDKEGEAGGAADIVVTDSACKPA